MAFGKKSPGDKSPVRVAPAVEPVERAERAEADSFKTVTRKSGIDAGFIGLALGVIAMSAGGAIAAPSLLDWMQTGSFSPVAVRPLTTVVAGLDRDAAKLALAKEALPDRAGSAFMTSLRKNFPEDHDKLLGQFADATLKGGDRDALMTSVNQWSLDFFAANAPAIGRAGAAGFDQAVDLLIAAFDVLEAEGGGDCTIAGLQKLVADPEAVAKFSAYGSRGYGLSMRASRTLVDLAAAGRNAPTIKPVLLPEDSQALQTMMSSMMQDKQVMMLMQAAMAEAMVAQRGGKSPAMASNDALNSLNVCQLGRVILVKARGLPEGAKSRLWAVGTSGGALQNVAWGK
jgi:hypothetical protein